MSAFDALPSDPPEIENPNYALALEDTGFTGPDVETDERAITETIFASLTRRVEGWVAHDGNLEVWLIEAFAAVAAEIRSLAADVPAAIFTTYGEEVLAIPIRVPTPALAQSTWTAADDLGYSIPIGTQFTVARTGDELIAFQVTVGATILPGERSVGGVEVAAVESGARANALSGPGEIVDPLSWVETIDMSAASGGDDGQDATTYLNELSMLMRVIALRPILPGDFAILALRVVGVGRAVAMDGYDPDSRTWGHARTISLILTDDNGEPVPPATATQVRTTLEQLREVNFVVNVIAPDYEAVDVGYEVTTFAEQNPDLVRDACDAALRDYLSPANWRLGTTSPGISAGEVIPPPLGDAEPGRMVVRRNELIGLLDRVRGVDWVDDVTINGEAADQTLDGPTTLPRPGEIEGTANVQ